VRTVKNRFLLLLLCALAILFLTSCSRTFVIKPIGQFGKQITFQFYKTASDVDPSKFSIVEFVVQEQVDTDKWVTVWELTGDQSLDRIEYGMKYKGLDEVVSAKPFSKDKQYRVLVLEITWPNPKGYAGVSFSFQNDGTISFDN